MRNYEMVLVALKSGTAKTMEQLKTEIPDLQVQFMHKYVARAKYLASAEIELMKAGQVIKTARASQAETLRLVNADKFKSYNPETKTGGTLHRKAKPPKIKAPAKVKAPAPAKVKAPAPAKVKAPAKIKVTLEKAFDIARVGRRARVTPEATNLVNPVAAPDQPGHGEVKDTSHGAKVVDMIKAELAATAPKGGKKAAALPRGPMTDLQPTKVERVTNEVTPLKDPDDLLEIPEFLQIKRGPKLAEE